MYICKTVDVLSTTMYVRDYGNDGNLKSVDATGICVLSNSLMDSNNVTT